MISSRTKLTTMVFGAALLLVGAKSAAAQAPEGIKVHGNWVLEVRNADGSLVERRAFKNSLQPQGKRDLAALLGRGELGHWRVNTFNTANLCLAGTEYCSLREPEDNSGSGGLPMARTVTVAVVNDQTVLRASFVANADGQIHTVFTQMMRPGSGSDIFTMTGLATPVNVQATQSVSLTVTFSFQ